MSGFYVFYQGKEPVSIEPDADAGTAIVTFADGTTQVVPLCDIDLDGHHDDGQGFRDSRE